MPNNTNNTGGWEDLREEFMKEFALEPNEEFMIKIADWWLAKFASEKEGVDRKYSAIFEWLLGENGEFPDLSKPPHYKFRTELRGRLSIIKGEDK